MICHAGSALGEKANAAMEVCAANAEVRAKKGKGKGKAKGKGKGKGKGKSPKCPTVAEIMDMAGEEYAGSGQFIAVFLLMFSIMKERCVCSLSLGGWTMT